MLRLEFSQERFATIRKWRKRTSLDEIEASNSDEIMKRKTAQGGLFGIISNLTSVLIQIILTAILSRILDVSDYGLMAISMSIISFFIIFSDMGFGAATIQQKNVTQQYVSSLFWLSILSSIIVAIICIALSGLIAGIFNEPQLTYLIIFSSTVIFLTSIGSQHQALLSRQARWIEVSLISVTSQILAGLLAVFSAWHFSFGYWALALQSVAAASLSAFGFWTLCKWRPGHPSDLRFVMSSFSYGGYLILFNAVNYIHRQSDNLVVGQQLGTTALGLYSRGYNLFMLPLTMVAWPIARVVVPLLSRQQDNPSEFRDIYCGALACVYLVTAPLAGGLFLFADECVKILYGDKWTESAEVLRILSVAIILQPAYTSGGWIELSLGRTRRHFHASVLASSVYLFAFWIGSKFGILGVASAYLYANIVIVVPWLWWATRGTKISLFDYFLCMRGSIVIISLSVTSFVFIPKFENKVFIVDFVSDACLFGALFSAISIIYFLVDRPWSKLVINTIRL